MKVALSSGELLKLLGYSSSSGAENEKGAAMTLEERLALSPERLHAAPKYGSAHCSLLRRRKAANDPAYGADETVDAYCRDERHG